MEENRKQTKHWTVVRAVGEGKEKQNRRMWGVLGRGTGPGMWYSIQGSVVRLHALQRREEMEANTGGR